MQIEFNSSKIQTLAYLDKEGQVLQAFSEKVSDAQILKMYQDMIKVRVFDEQTMRYQRQGRVGTYAPLKGQEAAQIGSAYVLRESDWMYPTYRDSGATYVHGRPFKEMYLYTKGHHHGLAYKKVNIFPMQIIIGAQTLHAVGGAFASKYKEEDSVSLVYLGDGATSEGDVHEAMNFAGVFELPLIFFVQNNQYAISLPVSKQTASETIAQKSIAYGIDGIRVDGNDLIAVYLAMQEAHKNARLGKPTLIEAVTFRTGPHTTSDDEKKYRGNEEELHWKERDPLKRVKLYLEEKKLWDEKKEDSAYKESLKEVEQAFKEASETARVNLSDVLNDVYEELPIQLKDQQVEIKESEVT